MVELDRKARSMIENHRPFDHVSQFSDVAGPMIVLQSGHRDIFDLRDWLAHRVTELLHERPGEHRNVFTSLPEWRHLDWKNIQPIKQIFPELSFLYGLRK